MILLYCLNDNKKEVIDVYVKLKQFMIEHNIKSKDMAELLGLNESVFSKKINMKGSDFNLNEVRKLCSEYKLDGNLYFFYPLCCSNDN